MERDSSAHSDTPEASAGVPDRPDAEHFGAAIAHVDHSYAKGVIASGAAKGILYGLIETLGMFVGDPDLPEHARSGYQALLVSAQELRTRID
jgi:hypothetical protein